MIVGHSLGGRLALRACLLDPGAVAHVALLDITPSARHVSDDTEAAVQALASAPPRAATRDVFREHFRVAGLSAELSEWLMMNLARDGDEFRWRIDRAALLSLVHRTAREDLWPASRDRTPTRGIASGEPARATSATTTRGGWRRRGVPSIPWMPATGCTSSGPRTWWR